MDSNRKRRNWNGPIVGINSNRDGTPVSSRNFHGRRSDRDTIADSPPIAACTNGVPRALVFNRDFSQRTSGWQLDRETGRTSDSVMANDSQSPDDVDVEDNLLYDAGSVGGGGLAGHVSQMARGGAK